MRARAHGVGNAPLYGAPAPAATASTAPASRRKSFGKSEARRPQVQVGDPFTEKRLLEATLELIGDGLGHSGHGRGRPDQLLRRNGRARRGRGAARPRSGADRGSPDDTPYEIMLPQSQERMLVVAEPHRVADIQGRAPMGADRRAGRRVTPTDGLRVVHDGVSELVADLRIRPVTDRRPIYEPAVAGAGRRRRPPGAPSVPASAIRPRLCDSCSTTPTSPASVGVRQYVLMRRRTRVSAAVATRRSSCGGARRPGWRCRCDGNQCTLALDPHEAGQGRSPRRCATSPAARPGRWASPTASISAIRRCRGVLPVHRVRAGHRRRVSGVRYP